MRRRRFTVYFEDGRDPMVVLSYTVASTTSWMLSEEYPVARVEEGDYRVTSRTDAGWCFNRTAVRLAFEVISGYQLPPQLRLIRSKAAATQRGCFAYDRKGNLTIRIDRTLDRRQANRTLWHELAHLKQWCERNGDFDTMRATDRGVGYRRKSIEIEARDWEHLAETDMLLDGGR